MPHVRGEFPSEIKSDKDHVTLELLVTISCLVEGVYERTGSREEKQSQEMESDRFLRNCLRIYLNPAISEVRRSGILS